MRTVESTGPLRIGVLGAARIAPRAIIQPARATGLAAVTAIAARDPTRAQAFATRHDIPHVHASYADLIADPAIDAIYNPLPNSLHHAWTIAALRAGKHVLCEKPLASNAEQAAEMAVVAAQTGRVLMEAFHYCYHPLATRAKEIIAQGHIGRLRHIQTWMCIPLYRRHDIRYRYDLAGGALMDVGCYAIHMARFFAGAEPAVTGASARLSSPNVDRRIEAELLFPDDVAAHIVGSLWSHTLLRIQAIITGDAGELRVANPVLPHMYNHLTLHTSAGTVRERIAGDPTYFYQLRSFIAAVREGAPILTGPADAIANMRVVDAVYSAVGLPRRA